MTETASADRAVNAQKAVSLSVIVPVYNSEETLDMLIARLRPVLAECAASSQSRSPLRGVPDLCEDDGAPQEARGAPRYVPKYQRLPSGSRIAKSREP